jgi:hypothetical protein
VVQSAHFLCFHDVVADHTSTGLLSQRRSRSVALGVPGRSIQSLTETPSRLAKADLTASLVYLAEPSHGIIACVAGFLFYSVVHAYGAYAHFRHYTWSRGGGLFSGQGGLLSFLTQVSRARATWSRQRETGTVLHCVAVPDDPGPCTKRTH